LSNHHHRLHPQQNWNPAFSEPPLNDRTPNKNENQKALGLADSLAVTEARKKEGGHFDVWRMNDVHKKSSNSDAMTNKTPIHHHPRQQQKRLWRRIKSRAWAPSSQGTASPNPRTPTATNGTTFKSSSNM
jgi:hypothetical protein